MLTWEEADSKYVHNPVLTVKATAHSIWAENWHREERAPWDWWSGWASWRRKHLGHARKISSGCLLGREKACAEAWWVREPGACMFVSSEHHMLVPGSGFGICWTGVSQQLLFPIGKEAWGAEAEIKQSGHGRFCGLVSPEHRQHLQSSESFCGAQLGSLWGLRLGWGQQGQQGVGHLDPRLAISPCLGVWCVLSPLGVGRSRSACSPGALSHILGSHAVSPAASCSSALSCMCVSSPHMPPSPPQTGCLSEPSLSFTVQREEHTSLWAEGGLLFPKGSSVSSLPSPAGCHTQPSATLSAPLKVPKCRVTLAPLWAPSSGALCPFHHL